MTSLAGTSKITIMRVCLNPLLKKTTSATDQSMIRVVFLFSVFLHILNIVKYSIINQKERSDS